MQDFLIEDFIYQWISQNSKNESQKFENKLLSEYDIKTTKCPYNIYKMLKKITQNYYLSECLDKKIYKTTFSYLVFSEIWNISILKNILNLIK